MALHKKSFEQTPCARFARAVPLTQGDNVLFELFSPSVRGLTYLRYQLSQLDLSNRRYATCNIVNPRSLSIADAD